MEGEGVRTVQGRQGIVTFRPYRDIKTKPIKKCYVVDQNHRGEEQSVFGRQQRTVAEDLYPEILCHVFSMLDTESKGRTAQVRIGPSAPVPAANPFPLQVCKRWRNICNTKNIWRGCEARLHLRGLNSLVVPSLLKRGITRVQVLSVRKSLRELVSGLHSLAPTLTCLNLSGCYSLTDHGLTSLLGQDLPALTTVNMSLCKEVTDRSLGRVAAHCPNLESLDLGGCTGITNAGLLLLSTLPALRHLSLRSCWQLSDAGVAYLSGLPERPGVQRQQSALESLNLQDCQKLTDLALRYIAQGLGIKTLNLSFCANVSDSGMKSVAKMSSLSTLNLRSCDNISDIGVGYLAEGCVGLQNLDVSFCERVSDRAMIHVASGLFNLQTLSMAACKITDDGLCKISKTLLDLKTLNIGQCIQVSDVSLEQMGASLLNLKRIDLYGCTRVTEQGLACLSEKAIVNMQLWH